MTSLLLAWVLPDFQGNTGQGSTTLPHTQKENLRLGTCARPCLIVENSETGLTIITTLQMRKLGTGFSQLPTGTQLASGRARTEIHLLSPEPASLTKMTVLLSQT